MSAQIVKLLAAKHTCKAEGTEAKLNEGLSMCTAALLTAEFLKQKCSAWPAYGTQIWAWAHLSAKCIFFLYNVWGASRNIW